MKHLLKNRYVLIGLGLLVTVALFLFGQNGHESAGGAMLANAAVISLTDAEKAEFNDGEQKLLLAVKKLAVNMNKAEGVLTKAELQGMLGGLKLDPTSDEAKTLKEELEDLRNKAKAQGTTLTELGLKLNNAETGGKSIGQVMEENKEELRKIFNQRSGTKDFMIQMNHKGEFVARPFDPSATKAAGPHASIADVGTNGNTSSIASSINAATILRMGGDAPIQSQYRNTPWVFDLCNLINVGYDTPFAIWYEEQVKQGASATVLEGGTKPASQYAYTLKSSEYKKEATLLGFTNEFQLDFDRLQSDILGKGRTDLINRINTAVLANITSAATAYNTAASFGTRPLANINDFVILAAMAAQVDDNTFGANANTAIMSTFKKYNIGTTQTSTFEWIDRPSVLDNLAFVGNPAMGADAVMVGDFKQYNILLRGGLIVRVGYNGTDFAENRFSVVMEQFYFDYISALRTKAIVKGADFATVKTALTEA